MKRSLRPTIGFLIPNLHNEYPFTLWSGIVDRAVELNSNIIIFRGDIPNHPLDHVNYYSSIYQLINNNFVDGLIMPSAVFSNYFNKDEFKEFYTRYRPLPIISLSQIVENIPSIIVDNQSGMRELVEHLICHHKLKRIAFVRGPVYNFEAEIRFNIFTEVMNKYNLPIEENLIVYGNFLNYSGSNAVKMLLDERNATFDALISCNDNMAIGAIDELLKRGIRVPSDVAVVGFDNLRTSKYHLPPLTTVNQPVYQQGQRAVDLALDLINGKTVSMETVLPTRLIIRSSCGCLLESRKLNDEKTIKNKNFFFSLDFNNEKHVSRLYKLIENEINYFDYYSLNESKIKSDFLDLINLFYKKMLTPQILDQFLQKIQDVVSEHARCGYNIDIWIKILNFIYQYILVHLTNEDLRMLITEVFQKALILIVDIMHICQGFNNYAIEMQEQYLSEILKEISSTINMDSLLKNIIELLPRMNINSFYAVFFEETQIYQRNKTWVTPKKALLKAVYQDKKLIPLKIQEQEISIESLIPEKYLPQKKRFTLITVPVFYREELYGYLIYEMGYKHGIIYDFLTLEISSTYRSSLLFRKREEAEKKLKRSNKKLSELSKIDHLTGVYNRRGFFSLAKQNKDLAVEMRKNGVIFYIDQDNLKKINDTYGHKEGDQALKTVVLMIKTVFRNIDIIGRIGGDEFVVFTIDTNQDFVKVIKKRMDDYLDEYNQKSKKPYPVSVTVGVAFYTYKDNATILQLINSADSELYKQKTIKRNQLLRHE